VVCGKGRCRCAWVHKSTKVVRDHCKFAIHIGVNNSFTLDPQTTIIPERDLYRLITRSQLPAAEKFEEWVYGEVLPTIRKTGSYTPATPPEMQIAHAIILAGRVNAIKLHCKGGIKCHLPTNGGIQLVSVLPERDVS